MRFQSVVTGFVLFWSSGLLAAPVQYIIDKNQTAIDLTWFLPGHHASHADLSAVSGQILFNPEDITADRIDVSIPFSTLNAHNRLLTQELQGTSFFDVKQYPDAHFTSSSVIAKGAGHYLVSGTLQIKQVKNYIVLDAQLAPQTNSPAEQSLLFHATTTILRSAYAMDSYLFLVGDPVTIDITLKANKVAGIA